MDFSKVKVNSNPIPTENPHLYSHVYQGCSGKCGTETTHYIIGIIVRCSKCGYEYKLLTRDEYEKQKQKELEAPIVATNQLMNFISKIK